MPETSAAVQKAYNEWVHQYDTNENSTRDLNAQVLRQQPFDLVSKAVLELGCGTGFNTVWLAPGARFVVGVDISEGMLRKARCRLGERHVHLLQTDITKPWPLTQGFDLIVATLVLEHVQDLAPVFAEAHRVLWPGGLLYIGELHPYKQRQGGQAKYRDARTGTEVLVPAFRHTMAEYINAGIEAGFTLRRLGEWLNEADTDPRLVTLLFGRT
ncbi:MAG TPA: class I SAM-dependent methyltransferase [Candidatus Binatia bacterium]|jgi:SAM-dependent methyltransferase|nr:class I SAM-dependent methyltransferase [Candidatus Binatia bacterium]